MTPTVSVLYIVIPAKAQGCPGKNLVATKGRNSPANFVLAGLDPAIHALGQSRPRRGCADQVRARRL